MAQTAMNPPTMQETRVQSLDREDPLEKEMATHSRILACRIPWTKDPGWLSPWGHKESNTTECLTISLSCHIKMVRKMGSGVSMTHSYT